MLMSSRWGSEASKVGVEGGRSEMGERSHWGKTQKKKLVAAVAVAGIK
jgi:hypothetical protein